MAYPPGNHPHSAPGELLNSLNIFSHRINHIKLIVFHFKFMSQRKENPIECFKCKLEVFSTAGLPVHHGTCWDLSPSTNHPP